MFSLFTDYIGWHYKFALVNIFRLGVEFTRFFVNFFSIGLFLRTLFLPLFSVPVDDIDSEDITDTVALFMGGIIVRILGAILRTLFIILGLFFCAITILFFTFTFILWLCVPIVFGGTVYYLIMLSTSRI